MSSLQSSTKPAEQISNLDSSILRAYITGKDRAWLLAHPEFTLQGPSLQKFRALLKKRAEGVPIAYLTGVKEFYGLELRVTPDVLIPRPETEAIVEEALKIRKRDAKLLDVGTGSGAIAIAIAKHRPAWKVTAIDISSAALKIARANAKRHQVKVKFIQSDMLKGQAFQTKKWDIVCANLPYVKDAAKLSAEGDNEPQVALRGGPDGLDIYRKLFAQLPPYLADKATLIIEADPWQHSQLKLLAQPLGMVLKNEDKFMMAFTL